MEIEKKEKERKMGRSMCPICGPANTFIIDQAGFWEIRLCVKCAKEQGYDIDTSKSTKCVKCGNSFLKKKSDTCPVCWIKWFKEQNK